MWILMQAVFHSKYGPRVVGVCKSKAEIKRVMKQWGYKRNHAQTLYGPHFHSKPYFNPLDIYGKEEGSIKLPETSLMFEKEVDGKWYYVRADYLKNDLTVDPLAWQALYF